MLVGTTSIDNSELISSLMTKEGIPHNVLNAKQHEREAHIVADAGRPGMVTIATNMAGRGDQMVDVIYDGKELHELKSIRFQTPNTHGTGCTLSSAIAVLMPQCETPWEAFIKAHDYLQQAIRCSGNLSVGKGHGPVDHFWMERGE